ncbi:hypothetical protein ACNF42_07570 [Cuniculiplasma sp. SKW3]|uniref:hypothetical protein n=1 Tax=Cuniculiplasma sp. SKW3 TaxID=3400170 RepID=UPI003FD38999
MNSFIPVLTAVVVIGTLHMMAPDHWLPLSSLSRRFNYTRLRTQDIAAILGITHSLISVAVGIAASILGLIFVYYLNVGFTLVGRSLLGIVAIYFILNGYLESRQENHQVSETVKSALAVSVFPDFAIIPFMFSTLKMDLMNASEIVISFVAASTISISIMAYIGTKGLGNLLEKMPPYYVDYIMGIILIGTIPFV